MKIKGRSERQQQQQQQATATSIGERQERTVLVKPIAHWLTPAESAFNRTNGSIKKTRISLSLVILLLFLLFHRDSPDTTERDLGAG